MAEQLAVSVVETKTVSQVQITGFNINYEDTSMEVQYMTLLDDNTPHQRGSIRINEAEEKAQVYTDVESLISDGDSLEVAAGKVAYGKVMAELG